MTERQSAMTPVREERRPDARALLIVGPAVVGAADGSAIAVPVLQQLGAAMPARIDEGADLAVLAADHDQRDADQGEGEIVSGIFHLAFVPDIDPGDAEDPLKLELKERGIGINLPMHPAGLNQT